MPGPVRIRRSRTASVRTQEPMFTFFLLAGGAVVGMTGSRALIGYGRLERGCSVRERREGRLGGGSGRHGEAWWTGGGGLSIIENSWTYHRCGYKSDEVCKSDLQYIYDVLTPKAACWWPMFPFPPKCRHVQSASQLHWAHVRFV